MTQYTPVMFDLTKIEENYPELFMQKETLEFQIGIYQGKFDEMRQKHYKDLLVYERMKKFNKFLLPSTKVLKQLNVLESDPSVKEFRHTLVALNRQLRDVQTKIDNEITKLNKMFNFNDRDLAVYVDELNSYFNNRLSFDEVMKTIFNKEFYNINMYHDIKEQRNYDVLQILSIRAPKEWKEFMFILISEAKYIYNIEDMKASGEDFELYMILQTERRNERASKVEKKLERVTYLRNVERSNSKEWASKVIMDPQKVANDFTISRSMIHKEILDKAVLAGDGISRAGAYIRDPANSATGGSADYTQYTQNNEWTQNQNN